jgi:protein-S-isoprenylcysteine O-methyltransferase Ste14
LQVEIRSKKRPYKEREGIELMEMEWIVFLGFSIGIILLSWRSLRDRRSHGFYRFFAFEAILALILLNIAFWFHQPFSVRQILSWALLLLSLFLAIHGFTLLRRIGVPDKDIQDPRRLNIEKTTRLVRVGAYRYIRHPLYSFGALFFVGLMLMTANALILICGVIALLLLFLRTPSEEEQLVAVGMHLATVGSGAVHHGRTHRKAVDPGRRPRCTRDEGGLAIAVQPNDGLRQIERSTDLAGH